MRRCVALVLVTLAALGSTLGTALPPEVYAAEYARDCMLARAKELRFSCTNKTLLGILQECLDTSSNATQTVHLLLGPLPGIADVLKRSLPAPQPGHPGLQWFVEDRQLWDQHQLELARGRNATFDLLTLDPAMVPDMVASGALLDLAPFLATDAWRGGWPGILAATRWRLTYKVGSTTTGAEGGAAGGGSGGGGGAGGGGGGGGEAVYSLALGSSVMALHYRSDVLAAHGLVLPRTWDQLLAAVAAVHGRPGGPGAVVEPEFYGLCTLPFANCHADSFELMSVWGSFMQTHGAQQGVFFDPATLTPLVQTPAMAAALRYLRALQSFGPPKALANTSICSSFTGTAEPLYSTGRCAFLIGPHPVHKEHLLLASSMAVRRSSRVAHLPGSTVVLDRESGLLVPCTLEKCPHAVSVPTWPSDLGDAAAARRGELLGSGAVETLLAPPPSALTAGPVGPARSSNTGSIIGGGVFVGTAAVPPSSFSVHSSGGIGSSLLANMAPVLGLSPLSVGVDAFTPPSQQGHSVAWMRAITDPAILWQLALSPAVPLAPFRYEHFDPYNRHRWAAAGYDPAATRAFLDFTYEALTHPNVLGSPDALQRFVRFREALHIAAFNLSTNASQSVESIMQAMAIGLAAHFSPAAVGYGTLRLQYLASIGRYDLLYAPAPPPPPPPPDRRNYVGRAEVAEGAERPPASHAIGAAVGTVGMVGLIVLVAFLYRQLLVKRGWGRSVDPGVGPTTTLVVTDIEESTMLWEELDALVMDTALSLHHETLRRLIAQHHGYESVTEGDSFTVAFHEPDAAVEFCLQVQSELLEQPWPEQVLQHEACRPVHVISNKRLRHLMAKAAAKAEAFAMQAVEEEGIATSAVSALRTFSRAARRLDMLSGLSQHVKRPLSLVTRNPSAAPSLRGGSLLTAALAGGASLSSSSFANIAYSTNSVTAGESPPPPVTLVALAALDHTSSVGESGGQPALRGPTASRSVTQARINPGAPWPLHVQHRRRSLDVYPGGLTSSGTASSLRGASPLSGSTTNRPPGRVAAATMRLLGLAAVTGPGAGDTQALSRAQLEADTDSGLRVSTSPPDTAGAVAAGAAAGASPPPRSQPPSASPVPPLLHSSIHGPEQDVDGCSIRGGSMALRTRSLESPRPLAPASTPVATLSGGLTAQPRTLSGLQAFMAGLPHAQHAFITRPHGQSLGALRAGPHALITSVLLEESAPLPSAALGVARRTRSSTAATGALPSGTRINTGDGDDGGGDDSALPGGSRLQLPSQPRYHSHAHALLFDRADGQRQQEGAAVSGAAIGGGTAVPSGGERVGAKGWRSWTGRSLGILGRMQRSFRQAAVASSAASPTVSVSQPTHASGGAAERAAAPALYIVPSQAGGHDSLLGHESVVAGGGGSGGDGDGDIAAYGAAPTAAATTYWDTDNRSSDSRSQGSTAASTLSYGTSLQSAFMMHPSRRKRLGRGGGGGDAGSGMKPVYVSPSTYGAELQSKWSELPPGLEVDPVTVGAVLVFRGFRVRCGLHSGVHAAAEVNRAHPSGRTRYSGTPLIFAKAVSDAAHGGIVLASRHAVRLCDKQLLAGGRVVLWRVGDYVLGAPRVPATLFQLANTALVLRAALQRPLSRTYMPLGRGLLDAPLAVVACAVVKMAAGSLVQSADTRISMEATSVFQALAYQLGRQHGAYLAELCVGHAMGIFPNAYLAALWAARIHAFMLGHNWSRRLLASAHCEPLVMPLGPQGEQLLVARGPRLKGVVHWGATSAILHPISGQLAYEGKAVQETMRMLNSLRCNQVVVTLEAAASLRRYYPPGYAGPITTVTNSKNNSTSQGGGHATPPFSASQRGPTANSSGAEWLLATGGGGRADLGVAGGSQHSSSLRDSAAVTARTQLQLPRDLRATQQQLYAFPDDGLPLPSPGVRSGMGRSGSRGTMGFLPAPGTVPSCGGAGAAALLSLGHADEPHSAVVVRVPMPSPRGRFTVELQTPTDSASNSGTEGTDGGGGGGVLIVGNSQVVSRAGSDYSVEPGAAALLSSVAGSLGGLGMAAELARSPFGAGSRGTPESDAGQGPLGGGGGSAAGGEASSRVLGWASPSAPQREWQDTQVLLHPKKGLLSRSSADGHALPAAGATMGDPRDGCVPEASRASALPVAEALPTAGTLPVTGFLTGGEPQASLAPPLPPLSPLLLTSEGAARGSSPSVTANAAVSEVLCAGDEQLMSELQRDGGAAGHTVHASFKSLGGRAAAGVELSGGGAGFGDSELSRSQGSRKPGVVRSNQSFTYGQGSSMSRPRLQDLMAIDPYASASLLGSQEPDDGDGSSGGQPMGRGAAHGSSGGGGVPREGAEGSSPLRQRKREEATAAASRARPGMDALIRGEHGRISRSFTFTTHRRSPLAVSSFAGDPQGGSGGGGGRGESITGGRAGGGAGPAGLPLTAASRRVSGLWQVSFGAGHAAGNEGGGGQHSHSHQQQQQQQQHLRQDGWEQVRSNTVVSGATSISFTSRHVSGANMLPYGMPSPVSRGFPCRDSSFGALAAGSAATAQAGAQWLGGPPPQPTPLSSASGGLATADSARRSNSAGTLGGSSPFLSARMGGRGEAEGAEGGAGRSSGAAVSQTSVSEVAPQLSAGGHSSGPGGASSTAASSGAGGRSGGNHLSSLIARVRSGMALAISRPSSRSRSHNIIASVEALASTSAAAGASSLGSGGGGSGNDAHLLATDGMPLASTELLTSAASGASTRAAAQLLMAPPPASLVRTGSGGAGTAAGAARLQPRSGLLGGEKLPSLAETGNQQMLVFRELVHLQLRLVPMRLDGQASNAKRILAPVDAEVTTPSTTTAPPSTVAEGDMTRARPQPLRRASHRASHTQVYAVELVRPQQLPESAPRRSLHLLSPLPHGPGSGRASPMLRSSHSLGHGADIGDFVPTATGARVTAGSQQQPKSVALRPDPSSPFLTATDLAGASAAIGEPAMMLDLTRAPSQQPEIATLLPIAQGAAEPASTVGRAAGSLLPSPTGDVPPPPAASSSPATAFAPLLVPLGEGDEGMVYEFLSGFADLSDPDLAQLWAVHPERSLLQDRRPTDITELRAKLAGQEAHAEIFNRDTFLF